jgi:hypothetical protein
MGYPSSGPEAVLAFRILLYCMAYIFGGAALIGLSVYVFLLCSEIFFSDPHTKARRAKIRRLGSNVPIVGAGLDLSTGEPSTPLVVSTEIATTVPVTLESDSPGSEVLTSYGFWTNETGRCTLPAPNGKDGQLPPSL